MKAFKDYLLFLPLYKVEEVCIEAQSHLIEADFQLVIEILWKCIALLLGRM